MEKKKAGTFQIEENVLIRTIDRATGKILTEEEVSNLIVNAGLVLAAKLICGDETTGWSQIAIGTGTTAATVTDTSLETEYTRAAADNAGSRYEASYKAVFSKTFSFASGVSENITEAAVSDSASASGETLLNRYVFSAKAVDADTDLSVTVTISLSTV